MIDKKQYTNGWLNVIFLVCLQLLMSEQILGMMDLGLDPMQQLLSKGYTRDQITDKYIKMIDDGTTIFTVLKQLKKDGILPSGSSNTNQNSNTTDVSKNTSQRTPPPPNTTGNKTAPPPPNMGSTMPPPPFNNQTNKITPPPPPNMGNNSTLPKKVDDIFSVLRGLKNQLTNIKIRDTSKQASSTASSAENELSREDIIKFLKGEAKDPSKESDYTLNADTMQALTNFMLVCIDFLFDPLLGEDKTNPLEASNLLKEFIKKGKEGHTFNNLATKLGEEIKDVTEISDKKKKNATKEDISKAESILKKLNAAVKNVESTSNLKNNFQSLVHTFLRERRVNSTYAAAQEAIQLSTSDTRPPEEKLRSLLIQEMNGFIDKTTEYLIDYSKIVDFIIETIKKEPDTIILLEADTESYDKSQDAKTDFLAWAEKKSTNKEFYTLIKTILLDKNQIPADITDNLKKLLNEEYLPYITSLAIAKDDDLQKIITKIATKNEIRQPAMRDALSNIKTTLQKSWATTLENYLSVIATMDLCDKSRNNKSHLPSEYGTREYVKRLLTAPPIKKTGLLIKPKKTSSNVSVEPKNNELVNKPAKLHKNTDKDLTTAPSILLTTNITSTSQLPVITPKKNNKQSPESNQAKGSFINFKNIDADRVETLLTSQSPTLSSHDDITSVGSSDSDTLSQPSPTTSASPLLQQPEPSELDSLANEFKNLGTSLATFKKALEKLADPDMQFLIDEAVDNWADRTKATGLIRFITGYEGLNSTILRDLVKTNDEEVIKDTLTIFEVPESAAQKLLDMFNIKKPMPSTTETMPQTGPTAKQTISGTGDEHADLMKDIKNGSFKLKRLSKMIN